MVGTYPSEYFWARNVEKLLEFIFFVCCRARSDFLLIKYLNSLDINSIHHNLIAVIFGISSLSALKITFLLHKPGRKRNENESAPIISINRACKSWVMQITSRCESFGNKIYGVLWTLLRKNYVQRDVWRKWIGNNSKKLIKILFASRTNWKIYFADSRDSVASCNESKSTTSYDR